MDRLELRLSLEVLRSRVAPPLGKTMKGEGYKIQEVFYFVNLCFSLYFVSCSFILHFFRTLHCFSPCIVVVYYGLSPCVTLTYCGPLPCVAPIRYHLLSCIGLTCCGP
jgi:hypothetical protein